MNFSVVYKKESSHQSSGNEKKYIRAMLPSSPLHKLQTSIIPIPAQRILTRGGAHTCGGRSASQVPQT